MNASVLAQIKTTHLVNSVAARRRVEFVYEGEGLNALPIFICVIDEHWGRQNSKELTTSCHVKPLRGLYG